MSNAPPIKTDWIEDAPDPLSQAKARLMLTNPFWSNVVLSLIPVVVKPKVLPTLGTDGTYLYINPEYVAKHSLPEQMFMVAHEAGHVLRLDSFRRQFRDPQLWNIACDLVINEMLQGAGFTLPPTQTVDQMMAGGVNLLRDPSFDNLSAEQAYAKLLKKIPPCDKCGGRHGKTPDGKCPPKSPCGCGGIFDAQGTEMEKAQAEEKAKAAVVRAATVAKMQGHMPGGLEGYLGAILQPKLDWRALLREFIQCRSRSDYDIRRPNRRLTPNGVYVPSLYSETAGEIWVGVDTSGSISDDDLSQFFGELKSIIAEVKPSLTGVIQVDAAVQKVDEYTGWDDLPDTLSVSGRGGTSFKPPFQWISRENRTPLCFIYFTDMCGDFPEQEPPYPVLWISTTDEIKAPWGITVRLTN